MENGRIVERSARDWPRRPEDAGLHLAPPPTIPWAGPRLGPSALMALTGAAPMVAFGFLGRTAGSALVMGGVLAGVGMAGPLLTYVASAWTNRRRTDRVRRRYLLHLAEVGGQAGRAASIQRAGLQGLFPDPSRLGPHIEPGAGLWERRFGDPDFGVVRLGLGEVPAWRPVRMAAEADRTADADPELGRAAHALVQRYQSLPAAPVELALYGRHRVVVTGPVERARALVAAWVAGLAVFHGPAELSIEVMSGPTSPDPTEYWSWVGRLPHSPGVGGAAPWTLVVSDGSGAGSLKDGTGATTVLDIRPAPAGPFPPCDIIVEIDSAGLASWWECSPEAVGQSGVKADSLGPEEAGVLALRLRPYRPALTGPGGFEARPSLISLLSEPVPDPVSALVGLRLDGTRLLLPLAEAAAGGWGPHGILVGATGSGKSELLRTLALSLATTNPPRRLNLLLIDFKGGAAFGGLSELPHVAGLVTNLADDEGLVERCRLALLAEVERRQRLLAGAGCESIREWRAVRPEEAEPDLLIVIDEFGEMLAAEPEFIEVLMTLGRLGRSLGLHLLLATQRLDEGRVRRLEPHLRYRLALRTNTAEESRSVLGTSAAFELPARPGAGYLRVDGHTVAFQAVSCSEEMPSLKERIGLGSGARARPVFLEPLARRVRFSDVPAQLRAAAGAPVIGVIDRPDRQGREALVLEGDGPGANLAVVGTSGSGKSTVLAALLRASVESAGEAGRAPGVYLIDFGGGGLGLLAGLPHVGGYAGRADAEAAGRIIGGVAALLESRAAGATAYNGDEPEGDVLLVVDNLGRLRQRRPDLEPLLADIASAGPPHRIRLVVSASRWLDLRPALLDSIGTRLELRLGDPAESILDRRRAAAVPSGTPGRGLTVGGHHFQALLPFASVEEIGGWVRRQRRPVNPMPVFGALPTRIAAPVGVRRRSAFPLGVSELGLEPVDLDLGQPGFHLLVYGDAGSGRSTLLGRLITHLASAGPDRARVHLVDPARRLGHLARRDRLASYSTGPTSAGRLAVELAAELVLGGTAESEDPFEIESAWSVPDRRPGPEHYLLIDDYERLVSSGAGPLGALTDLLVAAPSNGLHVVLARRVAGAARSAFEPFVQRLREESPLTLILSGTPEEGPLVAGVTARPSPPGQATLVEPSGRRRLVQCFAPADVLDQTGSMSPPAGARPADIPAPNRGRRRGAAVGA